MPEFKSLFNQLFEASNIQRITDISRLITMVVESSRKKNHDDRRADFDQAVSTLAYLVDISASKPELNGQLLKIRAFLSRSVDHGNDPAEALARLQLALQGVDGIHHPNIAATVIDAWSKQTQAARLAAAEAAPSLDSGLLLEEIAESWRESTPSFTPHATALDNPQWGLIQEDRAYQNNPIRIRVLNIKRGVSVGTVVSNRSPAQVRSIGIASFGQFVFVHWDDDQLELFPILENGIGSKVAAGTFKDVSIVSFGGNKMQPTALILDHARSEVLWEWNGTSLEEVGRHNRSVFGIMGSPDGRIVAIMEMWGVRFFDMSTRQFMMVVDGDGKHRSMPLRHSLNRNPKPIVFSADGSTAAWLSDSDFGNVVAVKFDSKTRTVHPVAFEPAKLRGMERIVEIMLSADGHQLMAVEHRDSSEIRRPAKATIFSLNPIDDSGRATVSGFCDLNTEVRGAWVKGPNFVLSADGRYAYAGFGSDVGVSQIIRWDLEKANKQTYTVPYTKPDRMSIDSNGFLWVPVQDTTGSQRELVFRFTDDGRQILRGQHPLNSGCLSGNGDGWFESPKDPKAAVWFDHNAFERAVEHLRETGAFPDRLDPNMDWYLIEILRHLLVTEATDVSRDAENEDLARTVGALALLLQERLMARRSDWDDKKGTFDPFHTFEYWPALLAEHIRLLDSGTARERLRSATNFLMGLPPDALQTSDVMRETLTFFSEKPNLTLAARLAEEAPIVTDSAVIDPNGEEKFDKFLKAVDDSEWMLTLPYPALDVREIKIDGIVLTGHWEIVMDRSSETKDPSTSREIYLYAVYDANQRNWVRHPQDAYKTDRSIDSSFRVLPDENSVQWSDLNAEGILDPALFVMPENPETTIKAEFEPQKSRQVILFKNQLPRFVAAYIRKVVDAMPIFEGFKKDAGGKRGAERMSNLCELIMLTVKSGGSKSPADRQADFDQAISTLAYVDQIFTWEPGGRSKMDAQMFTINHALWQILRQKGDSAAALASLQNALMGADGIHHPDIAATVIDDWAKPTPAARLAVQPPTASLPSAAPPMAERLRLLEKPGLPAWVSDLAGLRIWSKRSSSARAQSVRIASVLERRVTEPVLVRVDFGRFASNPLAFEQYLRQLEGVNRRMERTRVPVRAVPSGVLSAEAEVRIPANVRQKYRALAAVRASAGEKEIFVSPEPNASGYVLSAAPAAGQRADLLREVTAAAVVASDSDERPLSDLETAFLRDAFGGADLHRADVRRMRQGDLSEDFVRRARSFFILKTLPLHLGTTLHRALIQITAVLLSA